MHCESNASPKKPILITGGLGFIGGHLVDRLISTGGNRIRVFDNHRRAVVRAQGWPQGAVELIHEDIRNRSALRAAMKGCELVFHLAAQSNVLEAISDTEYSYSTNVGGTLNVLVEAREAGVNRVVFTSSREVYGDCCQLPTPEDAPMSPKNLYGASKAAAEIYCRALRNAEPEVVILRLANVYGPRDKDRVIPLFVNAALRGAPLTVYGGDQIIDFVWIDTVTDALLRAGFGDYIPDPVNIGSGVGISVAQLASRVLELIPSTSPCILKPFRTAEVSHFVADTRRAQRLLNVAPLQVPLLHLPDLIAWTRSAIGTDQYKSDPKPKN